MHKKKENRSIKKIVQEKNNEVEFLHTKEKNKGKGVKNNFTSTAQDMEYPTQEQILGIHGPSYETCLITTGLETKGQDAARTEHLQVNETWSSRRA